MKQRNSFVSNSSSCSFIFIGFDVTGLELNEDKIWDDGTYSYMNNSEMGAPDGKKLLGYDIITWNDMDPPETQEINITKLSKKFDLDVIRHEFGILLDAQPKIYIGTRMC